MRYLVSSEEMRAMDHYSIETIGIPSMVLMERAAHSVVEEIHKRKGFGLRVLILCGTGNNGADGLAMGRMMSLEGDDPTICVVGDPSHGTGEWLEQESICRKMGLKMIYERENFGFIAEQRYDIIVDSMLGTGLGRPVRGSYACCIEAVNQSKAYVAAVDIPSGVSADTGAILGTATRCDLTVTFQYQKVGLALFPGAEYAGECVVRDIGIVPRGLSEVKPRAFTRGPEELENLPARPAWSNKGTFGRVLVIAGSRNMAGASILAGEAAYRTGAGLVRLFAPECNREILQTSLPEAILTTYPEEEEQIPAIRSSLMDAVNWATAIVIGPGLGRSKIAEELVSQVITGTRLPTVIDADALNILAIHPEWMRTCMERFYILTPHMGEMSRLTGQSIGEIKADPVHTAKNYADQWRCVVVQKDARTVVSSVNSEVSYINLCGNSGMSTGGSGDVLAGIIGGLLAAGMEAFDAASYGVLMHAHAGDQAAEKYGERAMLARNLLEYVR